MGYYDGDWSVGGWLAMTTMMVLFWGLLIGLLVWAVRSFRSTGQRADATQEATARPDELLAERFARGEINEDEFIRRRELLQSSARP